MADDHIDQTIAKLQEHLRSQEAEVSKTKDTINRLCEISHRPPIYADVGVESTPTMGSIKDDEFYGQPLARSVRRILEMRKASGLGPATIKEIYEALVRGNYEFDAKNATNAQRGLRISLGKNVATFHKLPNGKFGLLSWYPDKQRKATKNAGGDGPAAGEGEEADADDESVADKQERGAA